MELEFLGTGTSTGVPQIGCRCNVCTSTDPHDRRLRASAILRTQGKSILIDCGPDFREQILRASDWSIDAVLITHIHYDHIGGIEDLRPYCLDKPIGIYAQKEVTDGLHTRLPYCFAHLNYPGIPQLALHAVDARPFTVEGLAVLPLPVWHYRLPIFGYRIGNFAYITDANNIPDETYKRLEGVDTLVINALRIKPHLSHFSLEESLEAVRRIRPRVAYLTHISHDMGLHKMVDKTLPPNVRLAYDALTIEVPD